MKKTAVYALSLIAAGVLTLSSCGNQATNEGGNQPSATSEAAAQSAAASLNIRYVNGDSIMAQYNLAKDVQDFILKTHSRLDNFQQSKGTEIQRLAQQIEEKGRNNGYLSEESYRADVAKLQRMQQEAENAVASMQRTAGIELEQQQTMLNDSIEAFIQDFNREKGYDAILFKSAGLYFNPALDITDEVVEGLNKRYNKVNGK